MCVCGAMDYIRVNKALVMIMGLINMVILPVIFVQANHSHCSFEFDHKFNLPNFIEHSKFFLCMGDAIERCKAEKIPAKFKACLTWFEEYCVKTYLSELYPCTLGCTNYKIGSINFNSGNN